ncbi:MAG: threonylcarbamoyl-AMP synthase [Desulfovibrio sp.]|jgi:L-threonylcarbamoyladenylate synthase|nr:threonylcarbamoyl-AMP synthase [Desulfovibrio sp.]
MTPRLLSLESACEALRLGGLIIFPTETFYAVGCNALNPDAVGEVFSVKRRPLTLPLPLAVSRREQLALLVTDIPPAASLLMDRFWPGPLSLILPARDEVPDLLTAGVRRLAVRCSPHPAVIALCELSGLVLVASSANISGRRPVFAPETLDRDLLEGVAGVFVAGPPPAGDLPSTVADVLERREGPVVRILREGAVPASAIAEAGFEVETGCLKEEESA